jgi:ferredoxin
MVIVRLDLDDERCTSVAECRQCVQVCPVDLFQREAGGPAHVVDDNDNDHRCIFCHRCMAKCPVHAVTVTRLP